MRRLGTWAALAMIVAETIGVGILLTPATMVRTLGSPGWVIGVWLFVGGLSAAGALCYAELATRFPEAGGGYVFLREAFGPRLAFLYGWMSLLVMDPGLTAALAIGLAQYLLVVLGWSDGGGLLTKTVAIIAIALFGGISFQGLAASARVIRWTATAKLLIVGLLVIAGVWSAGHVSLDSMNQHVGVPAPGGMALGGAMIAAFFAFGGWWDLGKMSAEVIDPRRTLPPALIGGVALVTVIYVLVTLAFLGLAPPMASTLTDEAFVSAVGARLFGEAAGRLLAGMVVIAVAGSLAAVLIVAPRVYLAMARDGVLPARLGRFDAQRGAARGATLIQVTLAIVLVLLGTFDTILGYFVPAAVFFLGLSAAAMLVLPRPSDTGTVFRAPAYPLPIALFLLLVIGMLGLFVMGRPFQTFLGAAVVALGVPVSWLVVRRG